MPRDASSLDKLLENSRIWRARSQPRAEQGLSSGYKQFDHYLPGGGWPRAALTEIPVEQYGIGELRLLMPALASLCVDASGTESVESGWIAWVAPPFQPYPPALQHCSPYLRPATPSATIAADFAVEPQSTPHKWQH